MNPADTLSVLDNATHPLSKGNEPETHCWELGYHDGTRDLEPAGDGLVTAAAHEGRQAALRRVRAVLADVKGCLKSAEETLQQSASDIDDHSRFLMTCLGRQPVGLFLWLIPCFYFAFAGAAILAEAPLSILTIGESPIGNLDAGQMDAVRSISAWALGGMMCLLGFSCKLLSDTMEHFTWRRWLEPVLVVTTMCLSIVSLAGIAHLREAIGAQATALLVNAPDDVQLAAAKLVAEWANFTYKWITLTLPLLSGACLIVAVHQVRDFRLHNRSLRSVRFADAARLASVREIEVLGCQIAECERELSDLDALAVTAPEVLDRYRSTYLHGVNAGRSARQQELSQHGIYPKLRRIAAIGA